MKYRIRFTAAFLVLWFGGCEYSPQATCPVYDKNARDVCFVVRTNEEMER